MCNIWLCVDMLVKFHYRIFLYNSTKINYLNFHNHSIFNYYKDDDDFRNIFTGKVRTIKIMNIFLYQNHMFSSDLFIHL